MDKLCRFKVPSKDTTDLKRQIKYELFRDFSKLIGFINLRTNPYG